MSDTTFASGTVVASTWLNDVNAAVYRAQSSITGSINRTALAKNADVISVKDFNVKMDGTTDDTTQLNAAATAARAAGKSLMFPDSATACKVSSSLDFSGITVYGLGNGNIHIQATSAQFDVITTTGATRLIGLYVNGGWDGATAGQTGDILSIKATNPAFPYNVHLRDCNFQYAKKRHIYWERGGYSSAWNVKCNAAGLHAIELFGNSGSDATTTVVIGGNSVFSDTPNGYGAKLTECISVTFDGAIMENTKGIQVNGAACRALTFKNVYQENTSGGKFLDCGASGGIGLLVSGCFGGATTNIPYPTNWQDVFYSGNSALTESAVPLTNRVLVVDGGQFTTAATGSFTAASLAIPPGTWQIYGVVQTINSVGATATQLAATISTNVADTGLGNGTSTLTFGADEQTYNPGANADLRVQPFDIIQNTTTANITYYLRTRITISAGTIAYRGGMKAVKLS